MFQSLLQSIREFIGFEEPPKEVLMVHKLSTIEDVEEEIRLMGWDSSEDFMMDTNCKSLQPLVGTYVESEEQIDPVGELRRGSVIRSFQLTMDEVNIEPMQSWLDQQNNVFVDLSKMY